MINESYHRTNLVILNMALPRYCRTTQNNHVKFLSTLHIWMHYNLTSHLDALKC